MILENFSYKKFFIKYGIFMGIVVLCMLLLIYSVIISKKPWQRNLKVTIERVLDEKDSGQWTVENFNPINNPFTLSAACYDVRNRTNGEIYKAVIIRVTTFYGPQPIVYLVDDSGKVYFMGFSSLHGRIETQLQSKLSNKRIEYWEKRIPEIIGFKEEE